MDRVVLWFLAAKASSDIGFALDFVCLAIFVWVRTESTFATGALGVALYAGGIVGGRLGQRYGGRWDRRRAMVAADLARVGALALLAVLPDGAQLWWLFPTMVVLGLGRSVFEATLAAATPALAGGRIRVQRLNSMLTGLKGIALVLGMGLATVAVPTIGFRGVFALDAASYGLSAVAVLFLPLRLREGPPAAGPGRPGGSEVLPLVGAGLALLVAVRGLDAFGSSSHHVGLPILGSMLNPANPAGVAGALWMTWAAGTFAGSFGLRPLVAAAIERAPRLVFCLATAGMSVGFIGIFWLAPWPARLAAALVAGVGDALSEIAFRHAVQQLPDDQRGAAFGLSQVGINAGFVAGLLLTGLALTPDRLTGWVLLLHGIPLLAALGSAGWLRRVPRPTTGDAPGRGTVR
jgi:MFS family permease